MQYNYTCCDIDIHRLHIIDLDSWTMFPHETVTMSKLFKIPTHFSKTHRYKHLGVWSFTSALASLRQGGGDWGGHVHVPWHLHICVMPWNCMLRRCQCSLQLAHMLGATKFYDVREIFYVRCTGTHVCY